MPEEENGARHRVRPEARVCQPASARAEHGSTHGDESDSEREAGAGPYPELSFDVPYAT